MSTIMVQVSDRTHTLAALHAACDLACGNQDEVVLLKLVPVNHPSWLGDDDLGYLNLTEQAMEALDEYQRTAERRGVDAKIRCVQVVSSLDGIVWAAECVNAQIVFAHLPHRLIPFWRAWQASWLRYHLAAQHCQLILSDEAAPRHLLVPQPSVSRN